MRHSRSYRVISEFHFCIFVVSLFHVSLPGKTEKSAKPVASRLCGYKKDHAIDCLNKQFTLRGVFQRCRKILLFLLLKGHCSIHSRYSAPVIFLVLNFSFGYTTLSIIFPLPQNYQKAESCQSERSRRSHVPSHTKSSSE